MSDYLHTCIEVDGVPVDLLLTENEVKKTAQRALKNPDDVPICNQCWNIESRKTTCGLLKWIMGRCCECGECD